MDASVHATDNPHASPDLPTLAALAPERVEAALGSRPEGLTTDEAEARLRSDGPNMLPSPKQPGLAARLLAQFTHFFALLLWVASPSSRSPSSWSSW